MNNRDKFNIKISGELKTKSNPEWTPTLSSLIIVQHPNYINDLFICQVKKYISEDQILVELLNNKSYIEQELNEKGVMIVYKSFAWKYVNIEKFNRLVEDNTECEGCNDNPINDTSLMSSKGDIIYKDLFGEKKLNDDIFDSKHKFRPLSSQHKQKLLEKLSLNEEICATDQIIVTNKNIALQNIINTKEDEIGEGNKIIKYLTMLSDDNKNQNSIFSDFSYIVFNGYVHITRRGLNANDKITEQLVPNLKYFKWQYNLPIDYDALKYVLFQNKFQQDISQNLEEQKDAEKIFAQEYLISLQPEPQYQMWALKRLLTMWAADTDLEKNIRKVKVLVNQWRARNDKNFNVKNGVLPSIVIYPRYGKQSAKIVLEKTSHYFLMYQNIGWGQTAPSYFIKVNNLVWYTNGNIDLKLYFKKTLQLYKGTTTNSSFDSYLSELLVSQKLLLK